MSTKPNNVPYAVRNDLCSRLNKSQHGMFLDEALRRGSIHALKIANSSKLTLSLVRLLNEHPATSVREVRPLDGGDCRWWAINKKKGIGFDDAPKGYAFVEPPMPPQSLDQDAQTTKYDAPPEPSPVVYSTKSLTLNTNAFEVLRNTNVAAEDAPVVIEKPQTIEKETVVMTSSALSQAALLRKQAEEMTALAANLEREDCAIKRLEELRPLQLEIARATAVLSRTSTEMLDAMETLEKASEKLRLLVAAR